MIYNRWGSSLKIIAYCGKHKADGWVTPGTLVNVQYDDDGSTRYQFAEFLKADGATKEIFEAVGTAPSVKLNSKELDDAIRQAL